jgi:hypothetical protein
MKEACQSPLSRIPSVDDIRRRIAEIDAERKALQKLLKAAIEAKHVGAQITR